jgi:hypothetical protein
MEAGRSAQRGGRRLGLPKTVPEGGGTGGSNSFDFIRTGLQVWPFGGGRLIQAAIGLSRAERTAAVAKPRSRAEVAAYFVAHGYAVRLSGLPRREPSAAGCS